MGWEDVPMDEGWEDVPLDAEAPTPTTPRGPDPALQASGLSGLREPIDRFVTGVGRAVMTAFPGPSGKGSMTDALPEADLAQGSRNAARSLVETAAMIPITVATGGAALPVRMGLQSGGAILSSLLAESVDPSEAPFERAAIAGALAPVGELVGSGVNATARGAASATRWANNRGEILAAPAKARQAAKDFVDNYLQGATPEQVDKLVQDAVGGGQLYNKAHSKWLYGTLETHMGGVPVPFSEAKEQLFKLSATEPLNTETTRTIIPLIENLQKRYKDEIPYHIAARVRSSLLEKGRALSGTDKAIFNKAAAFLNESMMNAADRAGPHTRYLKDLSSKHFKDELVGKFDTDYLKAVADAAPDKIYKTAVRGADVDKIALLRDSLGEQRWEKVRGSVMEDLVGSALKRPKSGDALIDFLTRRNDPNMNQTKVKYLLGQDGYDSLLGIAKSMKEADENLLGAGLKATWDTDGLTLAATATGGVKAGLLAKGLSLGPELAYKALTNPTFSKVMGIAVRAAPDSALARHAFVQLSLMAAKLKAGEEVTKQSNEATKAYTPDNQPEAFIPVDALREY